MDKVRIGIIGIGKMGTEHAENIAGGEVPRMALTAVADASPERRAWARGNLPGDVAVYDDGMALIRGTECDAVLVTTPHFTHPGYVIAALNAGKHVMCEKPAGVYTKQVREMNEAAQKSGKVFGIMYNQRTNCLYRKLRELVKGGGLGELKRVNWIITDWYRTNAYYQSAGWRGTWAGEGGGVLLNQCPHNLDLLQWICGMPSRVSAFCQEGRWHNIEVEDDVTAYLEFGNDEAGKPAATGVFVTSTGDAPGTNRLEITMDGGKLVCEDDKLRLWRNKPGEREFCRTAKDGFAKPEFTFEEVETDGLNEQHVGVLKAFTGRILYGTPLVAEGKEGINGLMIGNAMLLSSWLGRPVELPFDDEMYYVELNCRINGSHSLKAST